MHEGNEMTGTYYGQRKLLVRAVASAALGLGLGSPAAARAAGSAPAAGPAPAQVLEEALDDPDDGPRDGGDPAMLHPLLAKEIRAAVRRRVADSLAIEPREARDEAVLDLLERLADDREAPVRDAASSSLVELLGSREPLDAAAIVAEWGASDRWRVRLAAAKALAEGPCSPFDADVIASLARDPVAAVRRAAALAARARMSEGLVHYRAILVRARLDRDASVRSAARRSALSVARAPRRGRA